MKIDLNSEQYETISDPVVRPFQRFPQVRSSDGSSRQGDLLSPDTFIYVPPVRGFGVNLLSTQKFDDLDARLYAWDIVADVHEDGVLLPILTETTTASGLERARCGTHFKSNYYMLFEDGDAEEIVVRYLNSTTWTAGADVRDETSGTDEIVALDMIEAGGKLVVLGAYQDDYFVRYSSDHASTWSAPSTDTLTSRTSAILDDLVTEGEDRPLGKLAYIGDELVAACFDQDNFQVSLFSTPKSGSFNSWSSVELSIPSGAGPLGLAVYPGIDSPQTNHLYLLTQEALYDIDTSPSPWTFTRILDQAPSTAHNTLNYRCLAVGDDGFLYIGLTAPNTGVMRVMRLVTQEGVRTFDSVGLDSTQGVPSDMYGEVTQLKAFNGRMYAAVGGGTSNLKARILKYDGNGWSHVWQNDTANQLIDWFDFSSENDGRLRLHIFSRTAATASANEFIGEPIAKPNSGVTIKRASTGYIDMPITNGGMPTTDGALLGVGIEASSLGTTSEEYINIDYGVNGSAVNTTNMGDITSSVDSLTLASGAGVQAKSFGIRINLLRDGGDNTQSPVFRSAEVRYDKRPDILEEYRFTIDLDASIEDQSTTTVETVLGNFTTARDSKISVPFRMPGMTAAIYVQIDSFAHNIRMIPSEWQESAMDTSAERGGTIDVVVRQVV